jgi:pentatricopeptide repeat protein
VLVGLPKAPLHVENVLGDFLFRAITVKSIHGRRMFSTWSACEELLATGTVDLSPVITHEYPLSQFQEAFDVLLSGKACKVGIEPNTVCFSALIAAHASGGGGGSPFGTGGVGVNLQRAEELFRVMCDAGVPRNTVTYSTLITANGKCGMVGRAEALFAQMGEENVVRNHVSYGALIAAQGKVGNATRALELFREMSGGSQGGSQGVQGKGQGKGAHHRVFRTPTIFGSAVSAVCAVGDTEALAEVLMALAAAGRSRTRPVRPNSQMLFPIIQMYAQRADHDSVMAFYGDAKRAGLANEFFVNIAFKSAVVHDATGDISVLRDAARGLRGTALAMTIESHERGDPLAPGTPRYRESAVPAPWEVVAREVDFDASVAGATASTTGRSSQQRQQQQGRSSNTQSSRGFTLDAFLPSGLALPSDDEGGPDAHVETPPSASPLPLPSPQPQPQPQREQPHSRAKSEACRFFLRGACSRGDSCWYRHDDEAPAVSVSVSDTSAPAPAPPAAVLAPCKFFAQGNCFRGAECRFGHA